MMPDKDDAVARCASLLEQRRRWAVRPPRDLSIHDTVSRIRRDAERVSRRLGALVGLWEALLPPQIVEQTRLVSLRGGVLAVVVASSGVAYEVDRLLREGALDAMRRRYAGTLQRVSVRVGDIDG